MNPAFSVVSFTVVAGAAQGLVVVLAIAVLAGVPMAASFVSHALVLAFAMLIAGLGASLLHLGRPERAWRAAMMWRTSWLSREVIVLPACIGLIAAWWLALRSGLPGQLTQGVLPLVSIVICALLWYCTAMIYACLRFIEEWAHPLTCVNFVLTGLSSGLLLACAIGSALAESSLLEFAGPAAAAMTVLAGIGRWLAVGRNEGIRHRSTLQSATGIQGVPLQQKSMGMSAGSFNTREFFHHVSASAIVHVKLTAAAAGFIAPALLSLWGSTSNAIAPWTLAVMFQAVGLVADRWYFFAQAKHPQNLYYQSVS